MRVRIISNFKQSAVPSFRKLANLIRVSQLEIGVRNIRRLLLKIHMSMVSNSHGARIAILILTIALAVAFTPLICLGSANSWIEIKSENFRVIGDVPDADLRSITSHLEESKVVLGHLLSSGFFELHAPTLVVVFGSDEEYLPFKPVQNGVPDSLVAGNFISSADVNYIALSAKETLADTEAIAAHEYVHSLVKNKYDLTPAWFDEGFAEYFGNYERGHQTPGVRLGKQLARRAEFLKHAQLLPISTLIEATRDSPLYHDPEQRRLFYAESWAFIHYLMNDRREGLESRFDRMLSLTAARVPDVEAFQKAFLVDMNRSELDFRRYVKDGKFPSWIAPIAAVRQNFDMNAGLLNEASKLAVLGDLLFRDNRISEARDYLVRSLSIDSSQPQALFSLGLIALKEQDFVAASELLKKAVSLEPENGLAHYYLAKALVNVQTPSENTIAGFNEKTAAIQSELRLAIKSYPLYPDAYRLLALNILDRSPDPGEAFDAIAKAQSLAPRRLEFVLLLSQYFLRTEQFGSARRVLLEVKGNPRASSTIVAEAGVILDLISKKETAAVELQKQESADPKQTLAHINLQPCDMPEPGPQVKAVRFEGRQVCGRLTKVECADGGVVLVVNSADRIYRLHSRSLNQIRFVTYTSTVKGFVECGERVSPVPVLVTFKELRANQKEFDGELSAVEFIPEEWIEQARGM